MAFRREMARTPVPLFPCVLFPPRTSPRGNQTADSWPQILSQSFSRRPSFGPRCVACMSGMETFRERKPATDDRRQAHLESGRQALAAGARLTQLHGVAGRATSQPRVHDVSGGQVVARGTKARSHARGL